MPPVDFWQGVAATRPEIQSLDPFLNICLSEMPICKLSDHIALLHGFKHDEIALKAEINGKQHLITMNWWFRISRSLHSSSLSLDQD